MLTDPIKIAQVPKVMRNPARRSAIPSCHPEPRCLRGGGSMHPVDPDARPEPAVTRSNNFHIQSTLPSAFSAMRLSDLGG